MKKPEEYLKEWSFYGTVRTLELEVIIKQVQIDAYNKALEDAVESVKLDEICRENKFTYNEINTMSNDMGNVYAISNESILKLKK